MATDRPLSLDFDLREFPGWETASELEVQKALRLTQTILQPARRIWGRIVVTSWIRSDSPHSSGDAVDFVPTAAHQEDPELGIQRVHGWIATYHPTAFGELLYELPDPSETTPHIHATLPGIGGDGQVLRQTGWKADGAPRWELGYLAPEVLVPLLVVAAVVLLLLVASHGPS